MADFAKTLFVVRHAHRDVIDRSLDNGLSEKGRKQALAVGGYLAKLLPDQTLIFSSPRIRCQETLEPLSRQKNIPVVIEPLLDERGSSENIHDFSKRISEWIQKWKESPVQTMVVCSHGDWIPVFAYQLLGQDIDLSKAGLMEIKETAGRFVVFDLKQRV